MVYKICATISCLPLHLIAHTPVPHSLSPWLPRELCQQEVTEAWCLGDGWEVAGMLGSIRQSLGCSITEDKCDYSFNKYFFQSHIPIVCWAQGAGEWDTWFVITVELQFVSIIESEI